MKGVGFEIQASLAMRRLSSEVTFAKLYDRKTPITAADLLNDWVVPSSMNKTSRPHVFLLIVAPTTSATATTSNMSSISQERSDHPRTKTKSPLTNGICERFHKTVLDEIYRVAFRRRISICGSKPTMRTGHINGDGALAKRRCKLSLTYPDCEGKNDRSLITDQTTNQTTSRHCLSGQIQATTLVTVRCK